MHRGFRIIIILLLFLCLVLIRRYADSLFYDPLIAFFKGDYKTTSLPNFSLGKLIVGVGFRFWLNTLISLAILWFWFQKTSIIQFSFWVYMIVFVLLISLFILLLFVSSEGSYMFLFYVRRFLIQPLLVLLLIPAFYFQKNQR